MDKKPITHTEYMKSGYWKKLSKEILDDPDVKCGICGRSKWAKYKVNTSKHKKGDKRKLLTLQCHHTDYSHMGIPELEKKDILPICVNDHKIMHMIHDLAKKYFIWEQVYELLKKHTAWKYIENTKKIYMVPSNFKIPQTRKKKK